jgi:hypothetical protein
VSPLRGSNRFSSYPALRLRRRSPQAGANFWPRLWRSGDLDEEHAVRSRFVGLLMDKPEASVTCCAEAESGKPSTMGNRPVRRFLFSINEWLVPATSLLLCAGFLFGFRSVRSWWEKCDIVDLRCGISAGSQVKRLLRHCPTYAHYCVHPRGIIA